MGNIGKAVWIYMIYVHVPVYHVYTMRISLTAHAGNKDNLPASLGAHVQCTCIACHRPFFTYQYYDPAVIIVPGNRITF